MSLPDILILIVFVVFRKLCRLWLIGNKTLCRPFLSVIILVIDKSNFSFVIVRFCQSLVWLQTTLDPLLIKWIILFQQRKKSLSSTVWRWAPTTSNKGEINSLKNVPPQQAITSNCHCIRSWEDENSFLHRFPNENRACLLLYKIYFVFASIRCVWPRKVEPPSQPITSKG